MIESWPVLDPPQMLDHKRLSQLEARLFQMPTFLGSLFPNVILAIGLFNRSPVFQSKPQGYRQTFPNSVGFCTRPLVQRLRPAIDFGPTPCASALCSVPPLVAAVWWWLFSGAVFCWKLFPVFGVGAFQNQKKDPTKCGWLDHPSLRF